ncbi:hypothetical protein M011DRAFT_410998 [Sporormia fimetaria CBS 119925]|uniref:Mid2 domain-containing protein n=1 Tax=Sporormia fimetaria CBS 119925 TaxID=1340428 RepID=A0A6A6V1T1_9PLEO|nr:hypothetical protein M011DRAFT_410998 [Sporormia fimetaria CBS 119925]
MALSILLYTLYSAFLLGFAFAAVTPAYTVRNAPGASTAETYHAVRRAISEASMETREVNLKNSTILDRSWDGAVLLKFAHEQQLRETNRSTLTANTAVEIVCTKCYILGTATAELTIEGDDFDAAAALNQTFEQVQGTVENFIESVDDYFVDYVKGVAVNLEDGIDLADFAFPTFDYDFAMDVPTIPECNLRFQFDGMELYMMLDAALSLGATYQLNLYSSTTPLGISITKDLELGVVFTVDLILSVEGEIDISSGFHIKLDDGAAIDIKLFDDEVSDIIFNGGRFEFLPVTVESAGVVLSAILRVGVHAGFQLAAPEIPELTLFDQDIGVPAVGGGIEVGVFANVAEFITNVTYASERECPLKVIQSYQLALGAAAGATVAIGKQMWGPVATTSVPIWYTEVADACAVQKTASPMVTTAPAAERRQDLKTTTATTKVTHTVVACITPGLANCPASAQSTSQTVETRTVVTALASGEKFTFPSTVQDTVSTTVGFGADAVTVPTTTGTPMSYVPPPPPPERTSDGAKAADSDSSDTNKEPPKADEKSKGADKLIIGLSVGLGVPVLLALMSAVMYVFRVPINPILTCAVHHAYVYPRFLVNHRRRAPAVNFATLSISDESFTSADIDRTYRDQSKPGVTVWEVDSR